MTKSFGDAERLPDRVAVPGGVAAGAEVHRRNAHRVARATLGDRVDMDVAGEPVGRPLHRRRLGLDFHGGSSTRSAEFRVLWARHNVSDHRTGRKHAHHPLVGDLTLSYEALDLPGDPGQTMLAYTAEPNTPSAEGLCILASWTAPTTPSDVPGRDDADRTRKRRT